MTSNKKDKLSALHSVNRGHICNQPACFTRLTYWIHQESVNVVLLSGCSLSGNRAEIDNNEQLQSMKGKYLLNTETPSEACLAHLPTNPLQALQAKTF